MRGGEKAGQWPGASGDYCQFRDTDRNESLAESTQMHRVYNPDLGSRRSSLHQLNQDVAEEQEMRAQALGTRSVIARLGAENSQSVFFRGCTQGWLQEGCRAGRILPPYCLRRQKKVRKVKQETVFSHGDRRSNPVRVSQRTSQKVQGDPLGWEQATSLQAPTSLNGP